MRPKLPPEFLAYLRSGKSTEGALAGEPGWFQLWPEEQIGELNSGYEVHILAPHHYGFGSDGGGELLAFNAQGQIVMIPFIGGGEADAELVAGSWSEFEAKIEPARPDPSTEESS